MSFWKDRTTFVTGATGLMGGWLVKRLLAEGADVIALVRDKVPNSMVVREGVIERCTQIQGSLADASLIRRVLTEYAVDTVFHLAAQPLVGVAKNDPVGTLEANVIGTWNELEASRLSPAIRQVIVASSDKAYGDSPNLPYTEAHPLEGRFPYDCSKSCADLICSMYSTTYNTPVCVVRCANLYGGGDLNFNRVIPGAIQATLKGEPFVIRSDGRFVRDFLYVEDAALGYMFVAEKLAANRDLIGEAFNLSLEAKLSVVDVVNDVLRLMGRTDLQPLILNQANSEIRQQYMFCGKARRMLGWKPQFSFEDGLTETIAWYRAHLSSLEKGLAASA